MVADRPLGLPCRERAKWHQLGDDGGCRIRCACTCDVDASADREAVKLIFPDVERQPLLPAVLDHQYGFAGANVFADFSDDHTDDAGGRRPQDGLVELSFEHGECGGRRLDLRVGDEAFLLGRPRDRGGMIGLGLGDVGLCGRCVVFRLIECLL
jgi:hypothetical protein